MLCHHCILEDLEQCLAHSGQSVPSLVVQMVKNLPVMQETGFNPWVGKIPWRREWQPIPVFLPGEFHGEEPGKLQSMGLQRVRHDWVTNIHNIPFYVCVTFCFGEGDGTLLQYSCLENPMAEEAGRLQSLGS